MTKREEFFYLAYGLAAWCILAAACGLPHVLRFIMAAGPSFRMGWIWSDAFPRK